MSGVIKTVFGIGLMFVGIFSYNLQLAKAGYYLAMSGIIDEVSKLFMPKPPKQQMRQDVEYAGTAEPRRLIYGVSRVAGPRVAVTMGMVRCGSR